MIIPEQRTEGSVGAKYIDICMKDIQLVGVACTKAMWHIHRKQGVQYGWRRVPGKVVGDEVRDVAESSEGDTHTI